MPVRAAIGNGRRAGEEGPLGVGVHGVEDDGVRARPAARRAARRAPSPPATRRARPGRRRPGSGGRRRAPARRRRCAPTASCTCRRSTKATSCCGAQVHTRSAGSAPASAVSSSACWAASVAEQLVVGVPRRLRRSRTGPAARVRTTQAQKCCTSARCQTRSASRQSGAAGHRRRPAVGQHRLGRGVGEPGVRPPQRRQVLVELHGSSSGRRCPRPALGSCRALLARPAAADPARDRPRPQGPRHRPR